MTTQNAFLLLNLVVIGWEITNTQMCFSEKHISTHLAIIIFLTFVCKYRTNDNAWILNDHLSRLDVSLAEKASSMNRRSTTRMNYRNERDLFSMKTTARENKQSVREETGKGLQNGFQGLYLVWQKHIHRHLMWTSDFKH